ncbi:ribosome biogenesis protein erb1 [Apiospora phragmitis]|uniref:Ribosome biogenesis protein ERB1 n=1 Tax=Apiospora phragmitis TaxID=2905665 RepID=A0ABR1TVL2_9PEZI
MAPRSQLKRKASTAAAEAEAATFSDDEFGDGVLEGMLSDDSEDEENSDDEAEEVDGQDEDLDSDEVPSDEDIDEKDVDENDGPRYRVEKDANGGERYVYDEIDPVYDSDDSDAQDPENTIGNIPLKFYGKTIHHSWGLISLRIGYNIDGKKIMRPATGQALDALLDSIEIPQGWTGLTDPATGKPLNLSRDELELLRRVQMQEIPEEGYDPYPEYVPWFTHEEETMPISAAPEPKRRFLPSKHEQQRIMKIVRAIREGRIQPYKPPEEREQEEDEEEEMYDLWANEQAQPPHVMHIPAPKVAPPGFDLSYNPPPEYLPNKDEKKKWEETDPEEREKPYLPQGYDALRKVPAYDIFVKETFERYLSRSLPRPSCQENTLEYRSKLATSKTSPCRRVEAIPTVGAVEYNHGTRVRSVAIDPTGEWVASGGDDGAVKFWELRSGKQMASIRISADEPVNAVRWRPGSAILTAAAGQDVYFIIPPMLDQEVQQANRAALDTGFGYATNGKQATLTSNGARKDPPGTWARPGARLEDQGVLLKITVRADVKVINWHRRGDFFCTVSPTGQRSAVAIHTLSKHLTQIPFRKLPGLAQSAQFHPSRPLLFVALQRTIRVYDLQKQELVKAIQPGARWISSFDIHAASGDHLIVGSYDRRLLWHDLELSARPYKTMRFHPNAIRQVKYSRSFPLFADASDDGTIQLFHGRVHNDLMTDPTLVPLKQLKGHKVVSNLGVMDIDWHPTNPWLVSAGADGMCRLWA